MEKLRTSALSTVAGIVLSCAILSGAGCSGGEDAGTSRASRTQLQAPAITGLPSPVNPLVMPEFERITARGDTLRSSDLRGRVLAVNFWATWCGPCLREIPDLTALQATLADSGLTVIGVSLDHDGFGTVRRFLEPLRPNYPIVLDEGLASEFGDVYGLPATFLVNRSGYVVTRIDGLARPEPLRREIGQLLAGKVLP